MSFSFRAAWLCCVFGVCSALAQKAEIRDVAVLDEASAPELPSDLKTKFAQARIHVRLVIDETGHITKSRVIDSADVRLDAPVLAAIGKWKFRPALSDEKPVVAGLDLEFPLVWAVTKVKKGMLPPPPPVNVDFSPSVKAGPKSTPPGGYPDLLVHRQIGGEVAFHGVVGLDGHVHNAVVSAATHPDFVQPALEALEKWEFSPAMQGDLAIESETEGVITFDSLTSSRAEVLAANQLTTPEGRPPSPEPEPITLLDPVFPFDELLRGEKGSATAQFTVSSHGGVEDISITEATSKAYGESLEMALQHAYFKPAVDAGVRSPTRLQLHVEFPAVAAGAEDASVGWQRVLQAVRKNEVTGTKGLDERITSLYRQSPIYPPALLEGDRPKGEALIEVIIDRTGRVQLPHVISASQDAFGWAAATAVSTWVFKAPKRGGQPVDVKVRVPFAFTPPEK